MHSKCVKSGVFLENRIPQANSILPVELKALQFVGYGGQHFGHFAGYRLNYIKNLDCSFT